MRVNNYQLRPTTRRVALGHRKEAEAYRNNPRSRLVNDSRSEGLAKPLHIVTRVMGIILAPAVQFILNGITAYYDALKSRGVNARP